MSISIDGIVRPRASNTPAVPPAINSRAAPNRAARCPANVSAFTLSQLSSAVCADAGNDRHQTSLTQLVQQHGPAASWLPHETQVDEGALGRRVGLCLLDRRHTGVGGGQPDRLHPGDLGRGHQLSVHAAGEHPDDHVESGRVGHTEAIDRPRRDPPGRHFRVDLAPTAVHDDERGS